MADKSVPAGKVPPQNLDAEMSLLGAILIDEETLADITEHVKPKDFYDKRHAIIFDAIMRLYEMNKPVDLLTLTDELKRKNEIDEIGGSAYLTELTNYVPTAAHAESYAEIVAQKPSDVALLRLVVKFPSWATMKIPLPRSYYNKPKQSCFQSVINRSSKTLLVWKVSLPIASTVSRSFTATKEAYVVSEPAIVILII